MTTSPLPAASDLARILLVEDDTDIQLVAQTALEGLGGFTVAIAGSGAEALELAPRFQPDLILLDVMLPEMDGLSTLQALRATPASATTPVVFLTARVLGAEIDRYLQAGALDVIVKPFDPLELPSIVSRIWQRRTKHS